MGIIISSTIFKTLHYTFLYQIRYPMVEKPVVWVTCYENMYSNEWKHLFELEAPDIDSPNSITNSEPDPDSRHALFTSPIMGQLSANRIGITQSTSRSPSNPVTFRWATVNFCEIWRLLMDLFVRFYIFFAAMLNLG